MIKFILPYIQKVLSNIFQYRLQSTCTPESVMCRIIAKLCRIDEYEW